MPRKLETYPIGHSTQVSRVPATIHWKHESRWSVGIGWLISNRACNPLSASGSYEPPEDCVCIQAGVAGCRFFFSFCSQNSKRMNKHLIWVFRELVVLLTNNLEEGRNADTMSIMINHELDPMNLWNKAIET